jgi:hypothetical protein
MMISTARCGVVFLMLGAICGLLRGRLGLFSWGGGLVCVEQLTHTAGNKYGARFFGFAHLIDLPPKNIYIHSIFSRN